MDNFYLFDAALECLHCIVIFIVKVFYRLLHIFADPDNFDDDSLAVEVLDNPVEEARSLLQLKKEKIGGKYV